MIKKNSTKQLTSTKKKLNISDKTYLMSVSLPQLLETNFIAYGFVPYITSSVLEEQPFDLIASQCGITIYISCYEIPKGNDFDFKNIKDIQLFYFDRLHKKGLKHIGFALRQRETGVIYYLPYSLVKNAGTHSAVNITYLKMFNYKMNERRTLYENYNKEQYRY